MRRLTLFISVALALLIAATAGAKDRNHNGMRDRWEHRHHVHKAKGDPDRDGVKNLGEFHNGTNPRDADSDNDGIRDGDDDANHDGIDDEDEQSGVIASFDGTTLTLTLVNGDTLRGTVTDGTEIECENTAAVRHDGEGDNSGPGSGDDRGEDEVEHEDNCGKDALTANTIVREAELRLTSGGAVFREIELGGKAPA
jgi:hypothetical protein